MSGERRVSGVRSWWGWGYEEEHLGAGELEGLAGELGRRFGTELRVREAVAAADLSLPPPRMEPPSALAGICSTAPEDRARHSHGNAFRDVVRAFHGVLPAVTDVVARPGDGDEVRRVLEWCADAGAAAVPFGGGTSVVGGVNPPPDRPVVTVDTGRLSGVLEVDGASHAARIGAGTLGPDVEDALRPHGLTLRFFPQSWEFSTVGGWLATRAGGHFATLHTHIDDLVEAVSAVTPAGTWSSRRLPASGAGPSPDRLLLGSEGALGVVTDAWLRVRPRPTFRADASVRFRSFAAGCAAVRDLARSGLHPANCRLLDPAEAALTGAGDGEHAVLVLGFESHDHPLGPWMDRALELCADHGGSAPDGASHREGDRTGGAGGAAGAWRQVFLRAPYLRDGLVAAGAVVETFETAVTWDRLEALAATLGEVARSAAEQACGAAGVSIRLTHAYPDGAAPYVTVIAPGPTGGDDRAALAADAVARWDTVKAAVSEAIVAGGGTITHHHAVGRDHLPWYEEQRPPLFGAALRAVKTVVDPAGVMNPGVLVR